MTEVFKRYIFNIILKYTHWGTVHKIQPQPQSGLWAAKCCINKSSSHFGILWTRRNIFFSKFKETWFWKKGEQSEWLNTYFHIILLEFGQVPWSGDCPFYQGQILFSFFFFLFNWNLQWSWKNPFQYLQQIAPYVPGNYWYTWKRKMQPSSQKSRLQGQLVSM